MSHRKPRVRSTRMARIAAGVVIAAGASLTAVGTAQADTANSGPGNSSAQPDSQDGVLGGVAAGATLSDGNDSSHHDNGGDHSSIGVLGGVIAGTTGSDTNGGDNGAQGGQSPAPVSSPVPSAPSGHSADGHTTTTTTTTTTSSSSTPSTPGGGGTCTLSQDSVNCGGNNNTGTDNITAPQEVTQAQSKQQLAETGSSDSVFLLAGAATMIAGGVAFRVMPRLTNRRTTA